MFKVANDRITDTVASPYMFRLESQLKIKKSMYKQWRRLIMDWENLKYIQRQSIITRIAQELRRLGRGSELMTPISSMLKYKSYRVRDDSPKTNPVKRFGGTVAGAVAGRYAGKKIAQKFNYSGNNKRRRLDKRKFIFFMEEFSYNENVASKLLEGFNDFDLKNHQFVFLFN